MEYVEDGEMLSESWKDQRYNQELKKISFRDLSRIILSLSQVPLPRIGSWTLDNRGHLSLTNRPLIYQFHTLENEGIPTNISRTLTYTNTQVYYNDLLACHDSRIIHQPNSILHEDDGHEQLVNLFTMRGLLPQYSSLGLRNGPFIFNLTDLHGSNIFVDSNWNIKHIIDLEWGCSLPIEMLSAPYWLTSRGIDELEGDELKEYEKAQEEFHNIFEEEERTFPSIYGDSSYRANIMRKGWASGSFWFFHALKSPKGLFNLFHQHIQPMFDKRFLGEDSRTYFRTFADTMSPYWAPDMKRLIATKLEEKKQYEQDLRDLFDKGDPLSEECGK